MKKSLRIAAVILLLAGIASAGLAVRSYYRARAGFDSFQELQRKSFDAEERSDTVKGTPEEERLLDEKQKYDDAAAAALDEVKGSRRLALTLVIASAALILASIAAMILHLSRREADSQS